MKMINQSNVHLNAKMVEFASKYLNIKLMKKITQPKWRFPKTNSYKWLVIRLNMQIVTATKFRLSSMKTAAKMSFVRQFIFWKTHISINSKQLQAIYIIVLPQTFKQGIIPFFGFSFNDFELFFMVVEPIAVIVLF